MSLTATELEILKIIKEKNDLISMTELSAKAGFEIGYTYMLCKSLEKQGGLGFFTRSSCRITARGKSLVR
jgi:DNA-binding MarR family transcriptional regulator